MRATTSPFPLPPQGRPGIQGPPTNTVALVVLAAAVPLSGHRAVRAVPAGGAAPASSSDLTQANTVVGLTRTAALLGGPVEIVMNGVIDEPTWAWGLGPVFVGEGGSLTQTPPTVGFVQRVGIALSSTKLAVQIGPATIKA